MNKASETNEIILNNEIFKLIENTDYCYISETAKVYNSKLQVFIKPFYNKKGYNMVYIRGNCYNLAKILKNTFASDTIKTSYIRFADNNKDNLNLDNIVYCSLSELQKGKVYNLTNPRKQKQLSVSILTNSYKYYSTLCNETNLRTALSSQIILHEVEKEVLKARHETIDKHLKMILLIEYRNGTKIENICKKYNISVSKAKTLISEARKQLIADINTDISNGLLQGPTAQKPTQTDKQFLKEFNSKHSLKLSPRKKNGLQVKKEFIKKYSH